MRSRSSRVCAEDAVGVDASETSREMLRQGDSFSRLLKCLFSEDRETIFHAIGACEVTCTTYESACALRDGRVIKRLEKLAKGSSADAELKKRIVRFLKHVKWEIEKGEKLAAIAAKWQARAAGPVQRAAKQWIAKRRREKLLKEAQSAAASTFVGSMKPPSDDESSEGDLYDDDFDDEDEVDWS